MNVVGPGQTPPGSALLPRIVDILDTLCPMHVVMGPSGHVLSVGPTLAKLRPGKDMRGAYFLDLFELRRPRNLASVDELMAARGLKLHLKLRDRPATALKGLLAPLPDGMGAVINLSFGISIVDAVRDYALTSADFAATDLAIEMLYLVEAKSAAMEASRNLNLQLQGAMIAAEEQAFTDTLTGLKNRRAMDHVLDRLIKVGRPFALMHIDLDFFKAVNDTLGHAAGDHVLQQVARIMVEETRTADTVARIGGDEFVILFDDTEDRAVLDRVAKRIIHQLEAPIPYGGQLCHISASGGTVLSSDYEVVEAARMLADADIALYASKHRGRACHTFFTPQMRGTSPLAQGPDEATGEETGGEAPTSTEIRVVRGDGTA